MWTKDRESPYEVHLPPMPVDVMGIQPDHFLDEGIPTSDRVGHVQRTLEGR